MEVGLAVVVVVDPVGGEAGGRQAQRRGLDRRVGTVLVDEERVVPRRGQEQVRGPVAVEIGHRQLLWAGNGETGRSQRLSNRERFTASVVVDDELPPVDRRQLERGVAVDVHPDVWFTTHGGYEPRRVRERPIAVLAVELRLGLFTAGEGVEPAVGVEVDPTGLATPTQQLVDPHSRPDVTEARALVHQQLVLDEPREIGEAVLEPAPDDEHVGVGVAVVVGPGHAVTVSKMKGELSRGRSHLCLADEHLVEVEGLVDRDRGGKADKLRLHGQDEVTLTAEGDGRDVW
ncbi:hypothetical protein BH18ACT4_BH18ACT4_12680 [soil metagenome]